MKITQKATVELGRHQLASTGSFHDGNGPDGAGIQVTCRCGWNSRFYYVNLPDGNATPYIDGLMVRHQVEMMEAA